MSKYYAAIEIESQVSVQLIPLYPKNHSVDLNIRDKYNCIQGYVVLGIIRRDNRSIIIINIKIIICSLKNNPHAKHSKSIGKHSKMKNWKLISEPWMIPRFTSNCLWDLNSPFEEA